MIKKLRQWLNIGNPDPEVLFREISKQHPGKGQYSNMDRYQDFRQLFLGSEQGQRVLHEIFSWGHLFRSSIPPKGAPEYNVWISEGERNIALKIFSAIHAEPPSGLPSKTNEKENN